MSIVVVSGGFDPVHDGHIDYMEGAEKYGKVIVALNSDDWLMRKKGFVFMPWEARAKVLSRLEMVCDVVSFDDSDGTVCNALKKIRPDFFANGGDRKVPDSREDDLCNELGIVQVFNVGGNKSRSSSQLVKHAYDNHKNTV